MKRLLVILLISVSINSLAQPPVRRAAAPAEAKPAETALSERAQMEFPAREAMPSDVTWRRDVYRSLDLTRDANASLYYPLEPVGDQVNLFTYLFKLILRGQIAAYDYRLDGNEKFTDDAKIKAKDVMDRYQIPYEQRDTRVRVNDADLPAAEVLAYYIKESSYFNQQTSTFHTQVTALCPVIKRAANEWSTGSEVSYPMFWVKYDEVAPFLTKLPLMGSNYNNASTLSAADYFALNRYEGQIYKTTNLQGKLLANSADDSVVVKAQKRIEAELTTFQKHVWGKDSVSTVAADSAATVTAAKEKTKPASVSRRAASSSATKAPASKPSGTSSAPRVSVRRERR